MVGLLLVCSIFGYVGLIMASNITTFVGAMGALAVYAIGKTFFWPTMLAVVGDRFPQSGAVAMSSMGGIGMMSAGVLGGPGLGYAKDMGVNIKVSDWNDEGVVTIELAD